MMQLHDLKESMCGYRPWLDVSGTPVPMMHAGLMVLQDPEMPSSP